MSLIPKPDPLGPEDDADSRGAACFTAEETLHVFGVLRC